MPRAAGRVAPNMGVGGSNPQGTSVWDEMVDCEDDEGKRNKARNGQEMTNEKPPCFEQEARGRKKSAVSARRREESAKARELK